MEINKSSAIDRYFGDKKFYKNIMILAIPIIIQQLITGFVNMLDNIYGWSNWYLCYVGGFCC